MQSWLLGKKVIDEGGFLPDHILMDLATVTERAEDEEKKESGEQPQESKQHDDALIIADLENDRHALAVAHLADFIASGSVQTEFKLRLLDRIRYNSGDRDRHDNGTTTTPATTPTAAAERLLLQLAFCTGDYHRDNDMEAPPLLWEIRDICLAKLREQQRRPDHGWWTALSTHTDGWMETQRLLFSQQQNDVKEDTVVDKNGAALAELYGLCIGEPDHDGGIADPIVLAGLFRLRWRTREKDDEAQCGDNDEDDNAPQQRNQQQHDHDNNNAVHHVATFLASLAVAEPFKLAALAYLLRNSEEARYAYRFCTDSHVDTSHFENRPCNVYNVLWELRAVCLHELQRQREYDERVQAVAGVAADAMAATADTVQEALTGTAALVATSLLAASDYDLVVASARSINDDPADVVPAAAAAADEAVPKKPADSASAVVARTYSGTAKRATDHVRVVAAETARTIKTVAAQQILNTAMKVPVPAPHRTVVYAATHVALAGLGATATVGEAVFHSTGTLAQGASRAMANVVSHTHGDTAGQVVQDVADTVGNVLRTATYLALLTGGNASAWTKSVAKTTGKQHVTSNHKRLKVQWGTVAVDDEEKKDDDEDTSSVIAEIGGTVDLDPPELILRYK
jgi:hypothetical protein